MIDLKTDIDHQDDKDFTQTLELWPGPMLSDRIEVRLRFLYLGADDRLRIQDVVPLHCCSKSGGREGPNAAWSDSL